MPIVGRHDFDGSCSPGKSNVNYQTFSVGVFQWLLKTDKKSLKRSAVKVRVKGLVSDPEAVYARAREVVGQLDKGTYNGPKSIDLTRGK